MYQPNDIIEIVYEGQYFLCRVIRQEDGWEPTTICTEYFDATCNNYGWWYTERADKEITYKTELDWALAKMRDRYVRN
jgi:hypothetical protein